MQSDEIEHIYQTFREHMGCGEGWSAVFEFTAYIGFWPINCLHTTVRNGGDISVPGKYQKRLDQLKSPHVHALLAAYKHKRYSPYGRVKTFFKKWCHCLNFVFTVVVGLFIEMWH